ncbi:MAG: glutamate--cysteine ligase [Gemmatimonadetes bacterium]|nr:glutamate--cysteine ligase [Gemmatimonadota bacterium]
MVVDRDSLAVRPIVDELIERVTGDITSDVERGDLEWSNELVSHVLELKTAGPAPTLDGLAARFHAEVQAIDGFLEPLGARLLGGGAHPFMDPARETRLWPHDYNEVYALYDRVFGCSGHGWSNLQSAHLNLPFRDDEEFGRLHAAVRVVLPLLPGLAASTPILDGRDQGLKDARLDAYRRNQARVPSLAGAIIPERVFTQRDYERVVFDPIVRDMRPHDREGVLDRHFLNSRGAIARFDRGSIEIRLLDLQECPSADLAILTLVVGVVRALVEGRWVGDAHLRELDEHRLAAVLDRAIAEGEDALVQDTALLHVLGWRRGDVRLGRLWGHLADACADALGGATGEVVERLLAAGTLSTRILRALGEDWDRAALRTIYHRLANALLEDRLFLPDGTDD